MGTTADKLALLKANKKAIRDAITEKTGEDAGEVMSTYAEKIRGIESKPKYYRTTILLNQTITDPATMITKVYDDGGIDMIRANSHRYVCKLVDGIMQAKQLQDTNGTLYLDGSTANLTGGEGDVMMKLPKFYYRATEQETDKWLIDFVYGAMPSDDYNYWDGRDFIGVYEGYVANNGVYSYSGVASRASISQANFKLYASNRGAGYSLIKWKHHSIMAFLFFAQYLNTNSQSMCGHGTNSNAKATGQTNLLGMEDTVADVNGDSQSINYWGLENWWGNKSEFLDDITLLNGVFTAEGVSISVLNFSSVYPKKMYIGNGLHPICTSAGASDSTGFCDMYILSSSTTPKVAYRSGAKNGTDGGVVFAVIADSNTYTNSSIGSRLAYRGEYKIIE